jgi:putative phage-type endonuclease
MRVVDCQQGTDEWRMARLGKVGASMVADATARTKTGWGASRANLAARLVAERLTGVLSESFINDAMRWGTEKEPEARDFYSFVVGNEVKQVGLVLHPTLDHAVASPDGLVVDDGLVEIKCPNTATHIETLMSGNADPRYLKQMQWQMACTGRQWCDFASYDPRLSEAMSLHVQRVQRDDAVIRHLEEEITGFLREVSQTVERLLRRYGPAPESVGQHPIMAG